MLDDDYGAELDALHTERIDAVLEQAEMDAAGDAYHAALARYRRTGDPKDCPHGSGYGYRNPPVYPEQEGLRPGEVRCHHCHMAMTEADFWAAL